MPSTPVEPWVDPVIEVYKRDVDRTLLRESLRWSVEQRVEALKEMQRASIELQRAMREATGRS